MCFCSLSNFNAVALVPTGLHLALPVSAFSFLPPYFFLFCLWLIVSLFPSMPHTLWTNLLSGDANPEPPPIMPPEPPNPVMFDLKRPFTSTERRVLEEELAEKAKNESEDDEEDEEEERRPDIEKDDMLARRTGAFQKPGSGTYNRFLPQPSSKREGATAASLAQKGTSGERDLQYLERSIKTKRTKIGQRWDKNN